MTADGDTDEDRVIAMLRPSGPRAAVGMGSLAVLGAFLLWTAITTPPADPGWMAVMIGIAAVSFWGAFEMYRAAQHTLVLTRTALRSSAGIELFRVADVRSVERGALAFKPSGGFVVWLDGRQPAGWSPGVWWRYRRMVGVGGITRATEARAMAEILQLVIAERDGSLR
jgi:hypothetical protein